MDISLLPPAVVQAMKAAVEKELDKAHTFRSVLLGALIWELLVCLKAEYKYVWKRPGFMSVCYIVNRYWSLASFVVVYWMGNWAATPEQCSKTVRIINAFPILSYVAASILVINRVFSISGRDMRILAVLCTILLAVVSVQIVTVVKTLPNTLYSSLEIAACTPAGDNVWFYPYFFGLLALNFIAVALASVKLFAAWKQCKSKLVQTLLVDSLFWLAVCTLANLANVIYYAVIPATSNRALLTALPCVAQSIAACRILLAIRASAEESAAALSNVSSGPKSVSTAPSYLPPTPLTPVAFPKVWSRDEKPSCSAAGV